VSARRLLLLLPVLLATPAAAGPRTIDDCESIKEASAYNLCLASFGPVRGQRGANYPGVASEGEKRSGGAGRSVDRAAVARHAGAALGYGSKASQSHSRTGRIRMEFAPGRR
jgi:hypothetical protein